MNRMQFFLNTKYIFLKSIEERKENVNFTDVMMFFSLNSLIEHDVDWSCIFVTFKIVCLVYLIGLDV